MQIGEPGCAQMCVNGIIWSKGGDEMRELELLAEHASSLLARANVVGVGIGRKVRRGHRLPGLCLTVLVREKLPISALSVADVIPARIGGVSTDVLECGPLRPYEQTQRMRPACPGLSIGHYQVTAGTFGAVVYDEATGEPLILSNNHVLANSSSGRNRRANLGDPVTQPGSYDAGTLANDLIGKLERYIPLSFTPVQAGQQAAAATGIPTRWYALAEAPQQAALNLVDAAVAKPLKPDLVDPNILGIGPVKGTISAELDMKVQKSGRTTGLTTGTIMVKNVVMRVDYGDAGTCVFTNQLVSDIKSGPGDSGSLIVDMQNRAVGLLFAGGNNVTVLNPIADVVQQLHIRFPD